jgi:hypothetical protein
MSHGFASPSTEETQVIFADTANFDAFSRLRTSESHSLFDSQFTYDLQPLLWEPTTTGSGAAVTHDATNRVGVLTFASTPTGGVCQMQTFEHFRYTSGKGQLVFQTFNFNGGVANCLKYLGYSDGTNGIEFQLSGTTAQWMIRSASGAGNETVVQSAWNKDKLDGSGASGVTLDLTKTHILVIDFQALYVGRVRVGFNIGGKIVYVHEFNHANINTFPYLQTANLPLVYGMSCTGTVSTTMLGICSTVVQENGAGSNEGYHFTASSPSVTVGSGTRTHALSIQPKLTFNGIPNRVKFTLESVEILSTGNSPIFWEVCLGDVLTGTTTYADVNATYSATEYNTAGTTSGTPAISVFSGYTASSAQSKGTVSANVPFKYPICLNAAGAQRVMSRLTVLVTGVGGASSCRVSLNWKEIR